MTEKKIDFAEKLAILKKDCGIESKTRGSSGNSKMAVVKKILMEPNSCREEAMHKILTDLKAKGVDVKADFKKIKSLMSNVLTYVRHPEKYTAFKGLKLIDDEKNFQIVKE